MGEAASTRAATAIVKRRDDACNGTTANLYFVSDWDLREKRHRRDKQLSVRVTTCDEILNKMHANE